jgi:hypothetical protein
LDRAVSGVLIIFQGSVFLFNLFSLSFSQKQNLFSLSDELLEPTTNFAGTLEFFPLSTSPLVAVISCKIADSFKTAFLLIKTLLHDSQLISFDTSFVTKKYAPNNSSSL